MSDEVGYRILGYDFMVDEDLETYLIEVNQSPCFSTLSSSQSGFIGKLIQDTFE